MSDSPSLLCPAGLPFRSLATFALLAAAGCGGTADSPTGPVSEVITISPATESLWIGEIVSLSATGADSEGNALPGAAFNWTSSDPLVATVQADDLGAGVVVAVGEGTATITAAFEDRSGTAEVTVTALDMASVDPGTFLTCGVASDGTAFCWGANGDAALLGVGPATEECPGFADFGGDTPCTTTPTTVLGDITFASLSVGNGHTCGLDTTGGAHCWGVNNDGRLGTGDTLTAATPGAVVGGLTFTSIDAGGAHTCGLSTDGAAFCWGSNENGALGSAPGADTCLTLFTPQTSIPCSTSPVAVGGGLTFVSLDVSESGQHTCGLTETGTAYCWGRGTQGQLGSGTTTSDPRAVPGVDDYVSVRAGSDHTCGVTAGNEAYCWGGNVNGQLGHGVFGAQDVPTPPLPVSGGIAFASVSAGAFYTCAVDTDGAAHCWGKDSSQQLGTASGTVNVPASVFGEHVFASVSASWFHTCGLDTDGVAFCWGANEFGQLGTGTTGDRGTPARVVGQP